MLRNSSPVGASTQSSVAVAGLYEAWNRCAADPGCGNAWNALMEKLTPMLQRIARRVGSRWGVRDTEELADLQQDICLKISQQFRSISVRMPREEAAAELYCKAVAANAAHDSLRARFAAKRRVSLTVRLDDQPPAAMPVDSGGEREILLAQVKRLLGGSRRDQTVFWLYYRQGFTAKEIASIPALGLTNKGVESLLHRMTMSLRAKFGHPPERMPPERMPPERMEDERLTSVRPA
jgi:RNA polymerase sigma-70 factor (ECF subfamily)